jgi:hypothetical protein
VNPRTPILIGYFPKKVARPPHWMPAAGITAIYSVSGCISKEPDNWIERWTHNDLWVYSSVADAKAVVPDTERAEYEIHAYRMCPSSGTTALRGR